MTMEQWFSSGHLSALPTLAGSVTEISLSGGKVGVAVVVVPPSQISPFTAMFCTVKVG